MIHRQLAQHTSLDLNLLHILLPLNLGASLQLLGGIYIQLREEVDALLVEVAVEYEWCRCLAIQTTALRLLAPLVGVAIAVEADGLALTNQLTQHFVYRLILLLALGDACINPLAEVDK